MKRREDIHLLDGCGVKILFEKSFKFCLCIILFKTK